MKRIMIAAAVIAVLGAGSAAHAGETKKGISAGKVKAIIKKALTRQTTVLTPTGGGAVRG